MTTFSVRVATFSGKKIQVDVTPNETIYSVKLKVAASENIEPDMQHMICYGKVLSNAKLISDYGITSESTIHLVLQCFGH
jgi:hypothetical protein